AGAALPPHLRHRLDVVHLHRWPPGTPYLAIGADVADLLERPELHPRHHPSRWLVIDATGVGRPVVDLLLARPLPAPTLVHPVTITAGAAVRGDWWPVVPGLPLADVLKAELMAFRATTRPSADEATVSWREGAHDDLVLSVALAAWVAWGGVVREPPDLMRVPARMLF